MAEGFGSEHPQTVMTSHNLANLYTEMERFEEALEQASLGAVGVQ